ncbi:helix-turn-helix domain-containing protein [Aquabacterium sp. A7-Y]|uniref:GlxA family transcriptional regulator n=1 Tax=Aquabacterium sp. A7-Y TaxID=1349605 RepID=UPI00223E72BE|nr:helix-turn-helix domain-containing protein [Aquabacterium sp. A7-Y]MCW7539454.1 helix-turn-helix domain-containing protein [Aquabacterium sp. A7-Y]
MPTHHVGLLLYPGCLPAGLLAAADLMQAANLRSGQARFAVQWLGLRAGTVTCAHGVTLRAEQALDTAGCQALLVPGFWAHAEPQLPALLARHRPLVEALRSLPARVHLWAYCTGVALLAETGRLRGEPATGTWWMAPWLEARHPQVAWQWQQACVNGRRNATASGTHGYQAIVSEQVERALSAEVWRDVARFAVLPRPQPASPVFQRLEQVQHGNALMHRLRLLVEQWPASEARLARLAAALATSPRTLARKVRAAAGHTVGEHVRLIKLHQAGDRLLHTQQSVGQVGHALGFVDESSFRRAFKRVTGLTPGEFRSRYGD